MHVIPSTFLLFSIPFPERNFKISWNFAGLHIMYQSVYLTFKIHSDAKEISQLN